MLERKGNEPFKVVTVEKGEIILDDSRLETVFYKNFGTPRKPLTRIRLGAYKPGEVEEVLHVLEGPRKFSRRLDELWVPAKPPKQKLLKRTFKNEETHQKEIKNAAKAFIKKYRFTPNIIRFNLNMWKKMIKEMDKASQRLKKKNLEDLIPALQGADLNDSSTYWFQNPDGSTLLLAINSALKKKEFELLFQPMGRLMRPGEN